MTRTARHNEDARAQLTNDNPDPRMRPVVQRTVQKLRTLSTMEDPYQAGLIIDDMVYWHLVRKGPHPNALWFLLQQLHSYWLRSIGSNAALTSAEGEQLIFTTFRISSEDEIGKGKLILPSVLAPGDTLHMISKEKGIETLEVQDLPGTHVDLEDKDLKKRVRQLIWDHGFSSEPGCECGRTFEFAEQWANHVRSVIWKELKDVQGQTTTGSDRTAGGDRAAAAEG